MRHVSTISTEIIKAAIINEYVYVKEVAHSDKPTDNYYPITVALRSTECLVCFASFPDPVSCSFQLKMLNAAPNSRQKS